MRLPVRISASLAAIAALALLAGTHAQAQSTASPTAGNGTYIAVDPLANVRYDNRYDLSVGMAYRHIKAGPNLLEGSNLGGVDVNGSYWLTRHLGVEGTARGYLGTSGAAPNTLGIHGPFVQEYVFGAGPEWLGPHNKHGDLIAHAMFGGAAGIFEGDLHRSVSQPNINPVAAVGFYNNQVAPAAIIGGHIDLNRSAHWVFRVTPDAVFTWYGVQYGNSARQTDVNFAISVGMEYKFKKKR